MNWDTRKTDKQHDIAEAVLNNCEERFYGNHRAKMDKTEGTFSLSQQMHPKMVNPTTRKPVSNGKQRWFGHIPGIYSISWSCNRNANR